MELGNKSLADAMEKLAKEKGWKVERITVTIDEKVEKAVSDFIDLIEKAHKDTAKSKLRFDYCQPVLYYR